MGSSLWPPKVSMELHVKNREKLLASLRQHLSDSSRPLHGFVLLQVSLCLHSSSFHFSFFLTIYPISSAQGGEEQTRYDTDHLELFRYPNPKSSASFHFFEWSPLQWLPIDPSFVCFALRRQESFFAYLFGVTEPGFYGAIVRSFFLCYNLIMFFFFIIIILCKCSENLKLVRN